MRRRRRPRSIATKLLDELDYVGVLAVELFDVGGELLANEFAPRVHNTGHWTIDGAETSQFENHLRAILGLPLGSTAARGEAVMVNLVGALRRSSASSPCRARTSTSTARSRGLGESSATSRSSTRTRRAVADVVALAQRCVAELEATRTSRRVGRSRRRACGCAWKYDLAASAIGDVRVALGRPEVGVAEHLLHRAEVGAALEEVRRERVAEEVRVDATRLEPGAVGELAQDQECAGAGERAAAGVQEELGPVAAVEMRPAEREVAAHGLGGRPPERDEALLAALSEHAHDALLDRDAVLLEPDGLGHAEAGAVEELHERAIAQRARRRPDRRRR